MPTVGVQHADALWLAMLAGSGGHERRRERTGKCIHLPRFAGAAKVGL